MLRLLPEFKDAKLVRSRNPKDWEASDILVDVGAQYDGVKFLTTTSVDFSKLSTRNTRLSSQVLV